MILGEEIPVTEDLKPITELKFLPDNPRVYACTRAIPGFDDMIFEEQQKQLYRKLLQEPSVKNLIPEIKRHGGLMEPVLVRHDTQEVIEGNSRLAAYRKLCEDDPSGDWELIPCHIVDRLTERQQYAFLNQVHVKGKTKWSAFEKANFAYLRQCSGWSVPVIADLFGESQQTIRTRINVVKLMVENDDHIQSHFSYYDVLVRQPDIKRGLDRPDLKKKLLTSIRAVGSEDADVEFNALELRKKLPVILGKPKILRKYIADQLDLDDAFQRARISQIERRVRQARDLVADVVREDVAPLEQPRLNALRLDIRRLGLEVKRVRDLVETVAAQ